MRKIKEILRLKWDAHLSARKIATSCNISHHTVGYILKAAEAAGLSWPLPEDLDEVALENLLYLKKNTGVTNRPDPDPEYIHRELKRKNVTLTLLWYEYKQSHPDGLMYSQFCERYHQWLGKLRVSMHHVHKAGEKLFVDWAGDTFPIVDRKTGEVSQVYLFLATLGASSYSYAEGFLSQDLPQWVTANIHAFSFFQGVPEIVIPDYVPRNIMNSKLTKKPDLRNRELTLDNFIGLNR